MTALQTVTFHMMFIFHLLREPRLWMKDLSGYLCGPRPLPLICLTTQILYNLAHTKSQLFRKMYENLYILHSECGCTTTIGFPLNKRLLRSEAGQRWKASVCEKAGISLPLFKWLNLIFPFWSSRVMTEINGNRDRNLAICRDTSWASCYFYKDHRHPWPNRQSI